MMPDQVQRTSTRVLLLAYMFPPIVDGGGFRPAAFARYLPEFGYDPTVLTRPDTANLPVDAEQLAKLPASVRIERVTRGFSDGWNDHFKRRLTWIRPLETLLGRPPGWVAEGLAWRVAKIDSLRRWEVSWMHPAIELGMRLIERDRPCAIIATGPPFETLKAGIVLHERTGIPLVADFRDPWTYGILWNPPSSRRSRSEATWERRVVTGCAKVLVVTPSMYQAMIQKYPDSAQRVEMLMNGYEDVEADDVDAQPAERFVLRFVGTIMERRLSPALFEGLRRLRVRHPETSADLQFQLIGPSQCSFSVSERIREEGLSDTVEFVGPVSHDRCRQLMKSAELLLHIEPSVSYAVSSKVFEYLAAKRPILGMVPHGSDDEWFLTQSGAGVNVADDPDALASTVHSYWMAWRCCSPLAVNTDDAWLAKFHRREQTRRLAQLLSEVTDALPQRCAG